MYLPIYSLKFVINFICNTDLRNMVPRSMESFTFSINNNNYYSIAPPPSSIAGDLYECPAQLA